MKTSKHRKDLYGLGNKEYHIILHGLRQVMVDSYVYRWKCIKNVVDGAVNLDASVFEKVQENIQSQLHSKR